MKKQLCILADFSKGKNAYFFNRHIYEEFFKELNYLNIIDISKITKNNLNNKKKISIIKTNNEKHTQTEIKENPSPSYDNHYTVFEPRSLEELNKIFKENNFIIFYNLNNHFKYFKINLIFLKNNVKKFFISNLGYNPENFNYKNNTIFKKLNNFIQFRSEYYVIRFLVLINLWPKIDYFFESSSYVINSINAGLSKKIEKLTNLNISFYRNVIKINSRSFDNHINFKEKISEDYIVYIDSGGFDHPDVVLREGTRSDSEILKYYNNIYNFLIKLKEMYNKEIVVCLHPKNHISVKRNDYKNLKCLKFETEKMINKAFIVIYTEGSSIIQAFLLKKKIINLHGKSLGNYINERSKLYSDLLKLKKIDLENYRIEDKKNFLDDLEKCTNNYQSYVKNNVVNDETKTGIQQIIQYLELK